METLLLQPWNPTQTLRYLPTHFSVYLLSCQLVIYTLWKGMSGFISAVKALLKMFSKTTERSASGSQDSTVKGFWVQRAGVRRRMQRSWANSVWARKHATQTHTSTEPVVWARCNDIKVNLQIENRSRVLALVLGGRAPGAAAAVALSVWTELWEAVVHTHVFNGSITRKPSCCHCCATVCNFILKMAFRHWRLRKATSNIWKELLLFISFFLWNIAEERLGRCGIF